ncbi:MAG: heme exporter protein CcmD [Gammaproteobacteria bacterium RIFCSPHIGHO2_12_FULL_41_20]|nr:MAG: heme exporter protein CcmD [Gammaproteobacteria bacterium RIFCSPHIGHO2_12_FULL_41_20]
MHALKQFLHMGGYGFYVWSSYGLVAVALAGQWLSAWLKWRRAHVSKVKADESYS